MPPRSSSEQRTIQAARERRMIIDTAIQATGADRIDVLEQDRRDPARWRAEVHHPRGHRLRLVLDARLGTVAAEPLRAQLRVAA
jgi:hypothetical protein